MSDLRYLTTEARNPASANIDELEAIEIVRLMNEQETLVAGAVATQSDAIASAIDVIADRLRAGGRLIYVGAGTSGRLGVLDATECPPTFNSPPGQVVGVVAGGTEALTRAVEGAEDRPELAERDLSELRVGPHDVVVGIATSGRTPYVIAALDYARRRGCYTIALACNADASISREADLAITPVVGPEVISGSTRLKAGTATKLVLNMLSTGAMVRIGKTYGNLMVDLRATNSKLRDRTRRIIETLVGVNEHAAADLLARCGGELKTALVAGRSGCTPDEARERLAHAGGQVRCAIEPALPVVSDTNSVPSTPYSVLSTQYEGLTLPATAAVAPSRSAAGSVTTDRRPSITPITESAPPAAPCASLAASDLVLGIDGGGSRTVAVLAVARAAADERLGAILGRGVAGPSNVHAVGRDRAAQSLNDAIDRAFASAGIRRATVAAACLGLAGADRPADRELLANWANPARLAQQVRIENDAALVLAAGTPDGWGLAVIAGTGSFALARTPDGQTRRSGGWGHLIGDEGSGYAIALAGLRAVARAADGRGPATSLTQAFLQQLGIAQARLLVLRIYSSQLDRADLAALAEIVTREATAGDAVAKTILHAAIEELAAAALAAATLFDGVPVHRLPLAVAGGLLTSSPLLVQLLVTSLRTRGLSPEPVQTVTEPAMGAVQLARESAVR
jgi:N-acetylmuramic acid 6-phosphate etherase